MKRAVVLLFAVLVSMMTLGAGLKFEAPAVDISDTGDGYSLSFPEGGTIFLSNLQIRARQIGLTAEGKKVGETRVKHASFEGAVTVMFPDSNLIKSDRGVYEEPVFRLEGKVACTIGNWKCEATRVLFLTDTNTMQLEDGRLSGEAIQLSGRRLVLPLKGLIVAEGNVAFSAAGLTGECDDLSFDPDTKQVLLKEARITVADPVVSLKGTEVHLQDNMQTILVRGDIEATLGGADER